MKRLILLLVLIVFLLSACTSEKQSTSKKTIDKISEPVEEKVAPIAVISVYHSLDQYDGFRDRWHQYSSGHEEFDFEKSIKVSLNQDKDYEGFSVNGLVTFSGIDWENIQEVNFGIFLSDSETVSVLSGYTLSLNYRKIKAESYQDIWQTCGFYYDASGHSGHANTLPEGCHLPDMGEPTDYQFDLTKQNSGWLTHSFNEEMVQVLRGLTTEYLTFYLTAKNVEGSTVVLHFEDGGNHLETSNLPYLSVKYNYDFDNDSINNAADVCPGYNDLADADNDTVPDGCDRCPNANDLNDADGDKIPDACDLCPNDKENDIDGDSLCADLDECPYDSANDVDHDGQCGDIDACPRDPDNDLDGDSLCADQDPCPLDPDNDLDGDGLCADQDPCPFDPGNDSDFDGICDDQDICLGFDDQIDADQDGYPDACDYWPGSDDQAWISSDGQYDFMQYYHNRELYKYLFNDLMHVLSINQVSPYYQEEKAHFSFSLQDADQIDWEMLENINFQFYTISDQQISKKCVFPATLFLVGEDEYSQWQNCDCFTDPCQPENCVFPELGSKFGSGDLKITDQWVEGPIKVNNENLETRLDELNGQEKILIVKLRGSCPYPFPGGGPTFFNVPMNFEDGKNSFGTGNVPAMSYEFERPFKN